MFKLDLREQWTPISPFDVLGVALSALILEASLCTFSYISNSIKGKVFAVMLMPKNSCLSLFLRSKFLP